MYNKSKCVWTSVMFVAIIAWQSPVFSASYEGMDIVSEEKVNRTYLLGDDHYKAAQAAYENKDLESALQSIKLAIDENRDDPRFWNLFLDISREMGDPQAVSEALEELIRLDPDDRQLYLDRAYMLTYLGQIDQALDFYDQITARFGLIEQVATAKANIYQAQDNGTAAIEQLESFLAENDPETPITYVMLAELYTNNNEGNKALTLLEKADRIFPDQPLVLLGKADAHRLLGNSKEAFDYLKNAFESDKFDMDTKAGIIYNSMAHGVLEESNLKFLADQYVALYPQQAKAHAVRGDVYAQLNELDEATSSYKKALEIDRNVPPIWLQLLQISLYYGDVKDAQLIGAEAASLFPRETEILFYTGNAFLMDNLNVEARRYLEMALNSADPRNEPLLSQIYGVLGGIYNSLEMFAESDVAYSEALEIDSMNVFVLNNYAYYLSLRNEKLDKAEAMSLKSIELQPNEATYEDTYAWILFKLERYDEALVWIKNAISNTELPSATLLDHFGDILFMNGEEKEALKQWKKADKQGGLDEETSLVLSRKINEKRIVD